MTLEVPTGSLFGFDELILQRKRDQWRVKTDNVEFNNAITLYCCPSSLFTRKVELTTRKVQCGPIPVPRQRHSGA